MQDFFPEVASHVLKSSLLPWLLSVWSLLILVDLSVAALAPPGPMMDDLLSSNHGQNAHNTKPACQ